LTDFEPKGNLIFREKKKKEKKAQNKSAQKITSKMMMIRYGTSYWLSVLVAFFLFWLRRGGREEGPHMTSKFEYSSSGHYPLHPFPRRGKNKVSQPASQQAKPPHQAA